MKPLTRIEKESRLRQRAHVVWLFGLSGAGKTTLAGMLEGLLASDGYTTALLDGDQIRAGLSNGLRFSEADRTENLRRAAEVAKLYVQSGIVTICSFITPLRAQRDMVRQIIGSCDLIDIYVAASFATCSMRDTKGLYKLALANGVEHFTGKDSPFEPPGERECCFVVNTETDSATVSAAQLRAFIIPYIRHYR